MSKKKTGYEQIIKQLDDLKDHCSEMSQDGDAPWESDVQALQEAMDIIHDYANMANQYSEMVKHYQTEQPVIQRGMDFYQCPACGKRMSKNHTHCHWCGKKVGWKK